MKIGLVDVDGNFKKKKFGSSVYPNLAICKIAAYHKSIGDDVEWASALCHYDVIYMSKVFNFTADDITCYDAEQIIKGGTGYDIQSTLPGYIDKMQPLYDIYPNIPKDYAYGFLTRGCPNKCPWCVVPKKEGHIRPYMDVDKIAVDGRNKLVLMDNNILAAGDYAKVQLQKIIDKGYYVDFNQALDARLVTDDFARLLAKIKWLDHRRIRFGCDTPHQIQDCEKAMAMINQYGFNGEYFLYTMIGGKTIPGESEFDTQKRLFTEGYNRINYWHDRLMKTRRAHDGPAVYAYAQPYRDPSNISHYVPQWQKDMASWVNKRMIYIMTDFADFSPRKGFKCERYLDDFKITKK